ncbi:MAG: 2-C-methyl-D-erythritol 4-phosphate cytidylyltransferase [Oscillospiraceae bacterium]|nr:2-C-methyl-D-erythritol 4-phosphate cytidylyltransferase [Oscillospiraceae bacterium]
MSDLSGRLRRARHGFCTVVVVAAGSSRRMGEDKLLLELDGVPVLAHTLLALEMCPDVDELIVVTREELLDPVAKMREKYGIRKLTKAVLGGKTRAESALYGVMAASKKAKIIGIHDGARPFVTPELVAETADAAFRCTAAAPALPVKDTIKLAEDGVVRETPDRSKLFAVQTPQMFRAEIIKAALTKAVREGSAPTDDCAAAEAIGARAFLTPGDEENIKLTTPADLPVAIAILQKRRERA